MNIPHSVALVGVITLAALATGCSSGRVTNPKSPGPAAGNAVGTGIGAVGGNVAGAVVGVGEGAAAAAAKPFTVDNTQRVVRYWKVETTSDGRTIRVPEYYLVDENGQVIRKLDEQGK
jgi:hypothetical protein